MSGVEEVQSQATFDDSRIQWREAKTDNGATYQIGTLEDGGASESKGIAGVEKLKPGLWDIERDCDVNWKVGKNVWIDTTQHVKDTVDITRYNLHRNDGGLFPNTILSITNTQPWDYQFVDETGDRYQINCFQNGDHCVKYESRKPNIVHIHARRHRLPV